MKNEKTVTPASFIEMCGSYSKAVNALMTVSRRLWDLILIHEMTDSKRKNNLSTYRSFDKDLWRNAISFPKEISANHEKILDTLISILQGSPLYWREKDGRDSFHLNLFRAFSLARIVLGGSRPDHELRYFVMRDTRKHYGYDLSSETAHFFHLLASAVNVYLPVEKNPESLLGTEFKVRRVWNYTTELLPYLNGIVMQDTNGAKQVEKKIVELFLECCRDVGYLRVHEKTSHISFRTSSIDAEYLLSILFGLPTGIRGFDELFGNGGLMLAEDAETSAPKLSGRTILIMGRFGTGKTLLSLQLAVEIARKGGLAWMMPLEQTAEECLYTLESMHVLPRDGSMEVVTDVKNAARVLQRRVGERGVLIITPTIRDSFEDFLSVFTEDAKRMQRAGMPLAEVSAPHFDDLAAAFQQANQYPIRLISVDPFNSIKRLEAERPHLRERTLNMLDEVKRTGANIILVAEEDPHSQSNLLFEQNIADTVIRLSIEQQHSYAQRFFEITKSRLQREQRGRHHFSIKPGSGINIFPSTAAVLSRVKSREVRLPNTPITFGVQTLDDVLGKDAITAGDVIAMYGPKGAYKTPLGFLFLLGTDDNTLQHHSRGRAKSNRLPARSLLISVRDNRTTIEQMLRQSFIQRQVEQSAREHRKKRLLKPKTIEDILICSLSSGHINPGFIFQQIEDEFIRARLNGYVIDRVMIDNVAHWEMNCPLVRDDETFGDTLINFLKRHRVTSLLTCGDLIGSRDSVVQPAIIDGADCVIGLGQFEYRGINRVMLNIIKTRGMRHRRESFELTLGAKSLEVQPSSSLLRIKDGQVKPVNVRLFLHSESDMQEEYNHRVLNVVRAVLSPNVIAETQEGIYQGRTMRLMNRAMQLGSSSAIDELQIFQLDEFQVPDITETTKLSLALSSFHPTQWEDEGSLRWKDLIPRLIRKIRSADGSFFAVPFYVNVSLLAYRKDLIDHRSMTSWQEIAGQCEKWERVNEDQSAESYLFFDFPRATVEHFNSLFFEILSSFVGLPSRSGECRFKAWLFNPLAIEASKIFRRLCRRAYLKSSHIFRAGGPIKVDTNAVVWRHWYSTLNQMLYDMGSIQRENVHVTSLPNDISMAGEWYLGVPAYSAAPDIGLEIIKLITSREAELDRLRSGVGLPTRQSFYEMEDNDSSDKGISPYFSMNISELGKLVATSLRRSDFGCYAQYSDVIAFYLQQIIGVPDQQTEEGIKDLLKSLERKMRFIRSDKDCNKCRISGKQSSASTKKI